MTGILDRFRLDGRAVVVTGASSGLGVAFARACAEAGADVVVTARRADRLAQTVATVEEAGRSALAVPADVSSEEGCRRVVEAAVERFGRVDVLVNNAGTTDAGPASRLPADELRRVLDLNLLGCFWMAQAAATAMRPGSSIVNVSSIMSRTTVDALPTAAYAASKAGLNGLTRALARQWSSRKGIRVNALLPGFFPSEMTGELELPAIQDRLVMGRLGDPEELSAALLFLASDASAYVTGTELVVDGGFLLS